MPTDDEIEAGRKSLVAELENMPSGEIRRSCQYLAAQVLKAAEEVGRVKDENRRKFLAQGD